MSAGQSERIKISDDELVLLIFGQRRLITRLRGDERGAERRNLPPGLVRDIGRDLAKATRLHDRLMDIARSRGIIERVTTRQWVGA